LTAPARVAVAPAPSVKQKHHAYAPHRVCHTAQQHTRFTPSGSASMQDRLDCRGRASHACVQQHHQRFRCVCPAADTRSCTTLAVDSTSTCSSRPSPLPHPTPRICPSPRLPRCPAADTQSCTTHPVDSTSMCSSGPSPLPHPHVDTTAHAPHRVCPAAEIKSCSTHAVESTSACSSGASPLRHTHQACPSLRLPRCQAADIQS
jgi:hypothetical protein